MLELEKWRSFLSGKTIGGLAVINVFDLEKEKKIEILADALRLSKVTAADCIHDLYEGKFSIFEPIFTKLWIFQESYGKEGNVRIAGI